MKTIAEIIEEWKAVRIPIVAECKYTYEKDCEFEENPKKPTECKITMTLRDNYTHRNGVFSGWAHVGIFLTEHQNGDLTLRAVENQQFSECLKKFTRDGVNFRRNELRECRDAGEKISFCDTV